MVKDVDEVLRTIPDRPEQPDVSPQDFFKTHLIRLIRPTPNWTTRETGLPVLLDPPEVNREWSIRFGGGGQRAMKTFGFQVRPGMQTEFLGVCTPKGTAPPNAWIIYFRHTAQRKDFSGNLLEMGAGDYLVGRMQVVAQISASGKNVGCIIPIGHFSAGQGEFANNEGFARQCIAEVEANIYGSSRPNAPLLAACNSDGIFSLGNFLKNCPSLRARLKAIYDFDGSFHVASGSVNVTAKGAKTLRYIGANAPTANAIPAHESDEAFLARQMVGNNVPLPLSRWRRHPRFFVVRQGDDPNRRLKKGDTSMEVKDITDKNWLHHHIPTCMLQHGLAMTSGI